ncbi:LLM class flavin-dependent oxidoreductase [Janthinobacterium agaricidamnosum]|uniref:Putative monooxygenase moxC n=1 Tax=Janthinobacterium agaricidamnosum NBRC 102515 = DSM 9628 TaxID=1349767 RepID=W0V510_9BURK|nr:LLM class flavin-dependent oxidoreductase [Janthinobacterium agaricidamnosum]CDG82362.1 putative monooxygenase moxC [Janthinobacterium agaricidamnosum NBRC 102515 = DSM 9628]
MSTAKKQLKLGFILHGVGPGWGDWRHPDAHPGASTDIDFYVRQARLAEAGKFDFVFVADSVHITEKSSPHYLNRFEPLTILSALAAVTSRIGLVGTLTVSYSEPYTVARQFASLDHISRGRAGWNVVTSWLSGSAENYGKPQHPPHEVRYRIAAEHVQTVQGLWDSWEDDALTHDKAGGQFFDPAKLHALHHQGEFFSVRGPLNISRSGQGQPVIFQAGASEEGRNFSARHAEAFFTEGSTFESSLAYYTDIKARAAAFGRASSQLSVLPALRAIVGRTEEDAQRLYREAVALVRIEDALVALARSFNEHDLSQYPLDAPFPDIAEFGAQSNRSASERIVRTARDENLTLRQTALRYASPRQEFVGTGAQVADAIQRWFDGGAADGFILFEALPYQLDAFIGQVVPVLQERGLFRRDYDHTTLRGHLGLPVPENRNTAARRQAAQETRHG